MSAPQIVQKLWNYCNILRDDGLSYGDYVEQLTYLLFLKMADEQSRTPFNRVSPIPKGFGWNVLVKLDGDELETHYRHSLTELGKRPGLIGVIFRKAQNKIQDPAGTRPLLGLLPVSHLQRDAARKDYGDQKGPFLLVRACLSPFFQPLGLLRSTC